MTKCSLGKMKLHYDALQKSRGILQQRRTVFVPEQENQPSAESCVPKNNPMIPKCAVTMMEILNKQCAVFARLFHYSLIGCVLSFKISTGSSRTHKILSLIYRACVRHLRRAQNTPFLCISIAQNTVPFMSPLTLTPR